MSGSSARFGVAGALLLTVGLASAADPAPAPAPEALLERVRAVYAALRTYSDTGEVVTEEQPIGAPVIVERRTFRTRYAAPRSLLLDVSRSAADGSERFVIWSSGDGFHSWWSATGMHERYAPGEGTNAFALGAVPTAGAALVVPPLLFADAGLVGPLTELKDLRYVRGERVDGRPVHVLRGTARVNHWSDETRPTTLWIDAETLLIRRVLEDTPTGAPGLQRVTTRLQPVGNAPLAAVAFTFAPPRLQ